MDYLIKNIMDRIPTNQIMKILYTNQKICDICLSVLYNRIIRFDGSTTDEMLAYILSRYAFNKIDLSCNKHITDKVIQLLDNKEVVILDHNKQLTSIKLQQLNKCKYLSLGSININNECIQKLYNCKYLCLSENKCVTNECVKSLCSCHTIDLFDTDITNNCLNNLNRCHQLELGYTMVDKKYAKHKLKKCYYLSFDE